MRRTNILLAIFLAAVFALTSAPSAHAQENPKWEIFAGYTYMHSNIIITNAGFNLNGGSGSVAYHLTDWFALVGELDVDSFRRCHRQALHPHHLHLRFRSARFLAQSHAPNSLRTSSVRRRPRWRLALHEFARRRALAIGSSNDFNFTAGGGVDWKVNHRFTVRLAQAEYLHTQFANAVNNSENSFRLSTGVVFTFGQK